MYRWLELFYSTVMVSLLVAMSSGQPADTAYEQQLTRLLQQVVSSDGLVNYDRLRGDLRGELAAVTKKIQSFEGHLESDDARKAFWMNAYNVHMLNNIANNPEVVDIVADGFADEFFKSPRLTAGVELTLDEIEHGILRRRPTTVDSSMIVSSVDARIHVGLNCAAISCPRLRTRAFTASSVDSELNQAMRDFVDSDRHFRVEEQGVVVSSLLDWFGSDFDRTEKPAGDYLLSFMSSNRSDYDKFRELLAGKSSSEIRNLPGVTFEYLWIVNDVELH